MLQNLKKQNLCWIQKSGFSSKITLSFSCLLFMGFPTDSPWITQTPVARNPDWSKTPCHLHLIAFYSNNNLGCFSLPT